MIERRLFAGEVDSKDWLVDEDLQHTPPKKAAERDVRESEEKLREEFERRVRELQQAAH